MSSHLAMVDPLQAAFGTGQEIYKTALLSTVNTRRLMTGRLPVSWPAVGATPHDVMWRDGVARLLRYRPLAPSAGGVPLLLVFSLINRPYVLDLLEERSVVRRLLEAGIDVWLLDWGTPRAEDARRGMDDYALALLPRAAEAVKAATRADAVHLLGYCMGGTMALMAAAAGCLAPASIVALATPVDMHDGGLLSTWCRAPGLDGKEIAAAYGNVPPYLLQPAFKMLDPVGLATKLIHLDDKIGDDRFLRFFLAMECWLEDSVAFPGQAFADWVAMYQSNALVGGKLRLGGRVIDLRQVRCPVLNIVADADYITPPASSLALGKLAASHELIRLGGGHIGLSTGGAAHRDLWPKVAAWLIANGAPEPVAHAPQKPRAAMKRSQKKAGKETPR